MRRTLATLLQLALLTACAAPGPAGSGAASAGAPAPTTAAAIAAASSSPTAAPLRPLKMAYAFATAETLPMWVAQEQGIYRRYGLDVETLLLQSSAQVAPAMAAGEIDVALTAGAGVVDIDLAGGDQVIVASQTNNLMRFFIHARPELRRVEELRGQRIAITRLGSGIHLATTIALERAGIDAAREAQLIQAGTPEAQLGALLSGATDAVTVALPTNLIAEREGFPQLADLKQLRFPYMQGALATTRGTLATRYDVIRDFVAAHTEGLGVARRDPALAVRLLGRGTQTDDQELLQRSYDLWVQDVAEVPLPSAPGIQSVLDQRAADNPAARTADAASFLDERIVRELEAAGHFRRVLGGQ